MYLCLHVKYLLFLSDFNAGQIFEKYSNVRFNEILPVGAELFHTDGRTDRQTDRHDEASGHFSQFANAPNETLEMVNITTFFYVIKYRLVT